ncbi:MAG: beta-hydroxyacyl-ACP dehydratase [Planctomycetes bacterium]|nr:beta-hydroxyacyl-ACP dehydratase [Planctomycetota bacterium]
MPPEPHFSPAKLDFDHLVADREAISKINPQRFEMEQLDAVVYIDAVQHILAGYKDVRADEFWVRGHMPGNPLLPGILMCEAAAQLCAYYIVRYDIVKDMDFIGFGGMENVRFRSPVRPGDRLVLVARGIKLHRRQTIFNVQGFVRQTMVFHGDIIGVPLHNDEA